MIETANNLCLRSILNRRKSSKVAKLTAMEQLSRAIINTTGIGHTVKRVYYETHCNVVGISSHYNRHVYPNYRGGLL